MTVSSRFRNSSKRLIDRFGRMRVYIHKVDEVYDSVTQTVTGGETLYSIKAYKDEPKEREIKSPNLVDKNVAVMLIAAIDLPIYPSVGDMVTDQYLGTTEVFEVAVVTPIEAGDDVSVWRLACIKS